MRLAEIIFKGRKGKQAGQPKKVEQEAPQKKPTPKAQPATPAKEKPTVPPAKGVHPTAPQAGEVSTPLQGTALEALIKDLDMTHNQEEDAYYVGKLAYLKKEDLRGINPVMAGKRIENAIAQSLVEHYQADPEEVESLLAKYRKKFKNFGTTLYVRSIKDKMSGSEGS